jgi:hypothetical protein
MPNVIFCDSFDHYVIGDATRKGWTPVSGGIYPDIALGQGRNGTAGIICGNAGMMYNIQSGNIQTSYVEVAFKTIALDTGTNEYDIVNIRDAGWTHISVRLTPTGQLKVVRPQGNVILGTTPAPVILANVWYHIGFKTKIDTAAGEYELRINGVSVLSQTGVNTRHTSGGAFLNQVYLANSANQNNAGAYDDFILSTDGFCGDCRVKALWPQGNGSDNSWLIPQTSYGFYGGKGDRSAWITVTGDLGLSGTGQVDGSYSNSASYNGNVLNKFVQFDFGSPRIVTEAKEYSNLSAFYGNFKWQGSNDASAWTDIGVAFNLSHSNNQFTHTTLNGNATAYRYYKMIGTGGSATAAMHNEYEFQIDNTVNTQPNYQQVDEIQMNSDADYVYTNTFGATELYDMQSVGIVGNVKAVQLCPSMRKDDSGSRIVEYITRQGGIIRALGATKIYDSYVIHTSCQALDPLGAAWLVSVVDANEWGVRHMVPTLELLEKIQEARSDGI